MWSDAGLMILFRECIEPQKAMLSEVVNGVQVDVGNNLVTPVSQIPETPVRKH